jgi:tetratricopeptide (TPR) repeat protein
LAQDALAIFRHSLPEDHPKISESLNMLGLVRQSRRDFVGAIPLMRDVLARFEKSSGAGHPDTLAAKNNLAYALLHAGQLDEAERLQRDVLRRIGADNGQGNTALDRENLASTLAMQGKFAEAVTMSKEAVEIQRRREGDGTGNVAVALRGLAFAEELNGAAADAERDFRTALAMGEQLALTRQIAIREWQVPLADFLIGAKRCEEAAPLLQSALSELAQEEHSGDMVWQAEARLLLGECLLAGPQRAEGEAMQRTARARLKALPSIEVDLYPTARRLLGGRPVVDRQG